ncbi:MAG: FtsX-like permease family protein, partial [Clostridia bacterium]|nr:FtsX-like permease family protein [Clostridia bacterium]
ESALHTLVEASYDETENARFALVNSAKYELDTVSDAMETLSSVFLVIGIGFALFAGRMFANFIAQSILAKRQEIGILRAIGARSGDVFRIFFSESFIVASVNFVLSFLTTGGITLCINRYLREDLHILVTVLHFGVRQGLLLLLLSMGVALLASFVPVYRIASKPPIDAIKSR